MSDLKKRAAQEAVTLIEDNMVVGVGTGTTVNYLINELAQIKHRIEGCVASSNATEKRLREAGIPVIELNSVGVLPLYIDGADEVNPRRELIKGGGGALTREKILACAARRFVCIVDESKLVARLGQFPLAVEVIPLARSYVAREIVKLGGSPQYRTGFQTDNGNIILDIFNLDIQVPITREEAINMIPGVVENGLFARRVADEVLVAKASGAVDVMK